MYRFRKLKFILAAFAVLICFGISEVSANLKWSYQTDGHAASPVEDADGTVYAGSHDHHLYAIASDGILKWKYQTGAPIASSPAIGSDGTIYVVSWDRHLHAVSPSGSVKWKHLVGTYASCSSPAIASDGTIYLGSDDRNLYAIRPDGILRWKYGTGRYISASPAVGNDGTVYVGSSDRYLYAVTPDGTLRWKYQMGNEIASSPVVKDDGTIYVGSADAHLYALSSDGTLQWKYQTEGKIYSSPAISSEGVVYVGSYDNYLYALDPDGTLQWKYRTGNRIYSSPAIGPDEAIYVGSDDRKLHVINPDGTPRQQYQTGSYVSSSPAVGDDGTIYVGSDDSKIYAINPSEDQNGEEGITSAGDVAYSEDGLAWLTLVVGATSQTVHITIEKSEGTPSSEEGLTRTGNAYDFNAVNGESEPVPLFDEAVEVGMSYDSEGLGSADVSDLRIAYYDEDTEQWHELASTIDTQLHTVSAMTTHLGQFAIFAPVFNSAPLITSSPEILAYLNDGDYIYDVEAEDAEGDTLSFSLAQSPANMTIDSESGLITWMPAIGEHIVEVRVSDGKSVSEQSFTLSVDPDIISPFKAGEFTVGSGGAVTVDWLYDGGGYMSDLCFFSTKDMETYRSDPLAFAKEAARRCLSGKDCEEECADECGADGACKNACMESCAEGYLVISDVFEGARYDGSLGESHDWNHGPYKGVKSFRMKPGDKFA
ncbi:MAG: hypothetical protein DRI57_16275, partial [Deltaproteobacteria bacterium]